MKKIAALVMFLFLNYFSSVSYAGEGFEKKFDKQISQHNIVYTLKGVGVKSYLFVKVLVAGFYTAEKSNEKNALDDVPKRIEVFYFYKIPGARLAVETRRRMELNTSQEDFDRIKTRVDVMDGYFVNLNPGDRYALTYAPGQGTYFTYNEKLMGKIEGADFARALFAVWIGKDPISEALKNDLLGQRD